MSFDPKVLPGFYRAQLLPIQMGLVVLTNALLIFFPLPWNTAVLAYACTALILYEYRIGASNLYSFAILFSSILATIFIGLGISGFDLPWALLMYNVLLLLAGCLQLTCVDELTGDVKKSRGSPELLTNTLRLWVSIHASSTALIVFILFVATKPNPALIGLLPALPLAGATLTLWMHFGRRPEPIREVLFALGSYHFRTVEPTASKLRPFYQIFVREAMPSIRQGTGPDADDLGSLVALKMSLDGDYWSQTQFFAAYYGDEIVGTISCTLKRPKHVLGFEVGHSSPINVKALCRFGHVLEIGRLSVAHEHRFGRDVFQGLMRCVLEQAFQVDAAFLVVQSFVSVQPVYRKIGFFPIDEHVSHQTGLGIAIVPMAFNLAARVVCGTSKADAADTISEALKPHHAESYFKRQALRALLGRPCAWKLSAAEVISLLRPSGRLTPLNEEHVRVL